MRFAVFACLLVCCWGVSAEERAKPAKRPAKKPPATQVPAKPSPWAEWVEPDFPFFSSVLDARDVGEGFPKTNLTPRGLILNLGNNFWACFDTDLLRLACIWQDEPGKPPVTADALAPGSYHIAGQKTKDGQEFLPKPAGKVWLANGMYAGWQVGDQPKFEDPREPAPSADEVGRGSLPPTLGQFTAVVPVPGAETAAKISYRVGNTPVTEEIAALVDDGKVVVERRLSVEPHDQPLTVVLADAKTVPVDAFQVDPSGAEVIGAADHVVLKLAASATAKQWTVRGRTQWTQSGGTPVAAPGDAAAAAEAARWPETVTAPGLLSPKSDAYVIDDVPLPVPNPWKRNVRLADIGFLNDQGDAVAVTMDGDVWLISGLTGDLKTVTWKRFASGLHEPMSIVVRVKGQGSAGQSVKGGQGAEIFVFDRSGIWKLVDTDGNREADRYEMFCNLFGQTAETREFPNSMDLGPDGSLFISKGGQEGTTRGKHNGTVIRVAPDGKSFEVIGYGLRQPFIGVHPTTGLVTASDQQGNYVPSTPLHVIRGHQFYGHVPTIAPKEVYPAPITEPAAWIPHPVNPSGATQVWLTGARMGPVNDELIHVGYNRPELFRVLMNRRFEKPQAAVTSFSRDFDFGPLNGTVNPGDGQLYVVGFQIWGTTAKRLSGLVRLRHTGGPRVLLKEVTPTDQGVLLRFNAKLDEKLATDPSSYSAERWNYKRTFDYGSPHLKLDGSTGQEWMTPSSAYLSKDGLSVLVGLPGMKAGVHQMRIGWGLKSVDGLKAENTAYFSPWELLKFDPVKEGFGDISVDLTPRAATSVAMAKPTVEEGERIAQMVGCMACHSIDGTTIGKVGPSWKGIFGTERDIAKGVGKVKADAAYVRESITNPSAKVVKGFEKFDTGMPIYAGILNESQIESLVLYIQSLK